MHFICKFVLKLAINIVREIIALKRVYVKKKKMDFDKKTCITHTVNRLGLDMCVYSI